MMVGRNAINSLTKMPAQPGETRLQVQELNYYNNFGKQVLTDVSFSVRGGEILGVAGIEGNGQREISEMITGMDKIQSGEIFVGDKSVKGHTIREIRQMGVAHVSEDRMTYGIAGDASIEYNIISDRYYEKNYQKYHILRRKAVRKLSDGLIRSFTVKCDGSTAAIKTLSGGNIQKVVAAREFSSRPQIMIANQPTRGIDVGASELIRSKLIGLRDNGAAVLLISADITELREVSDSLIVLCGGRIVAYFESLENVTETELGEYMLGLKEQTPEQIARCCK